MECKYGATSFKARFIVKSASDGSKKTGLTYNTAGLQICVIADNAASSTAYTQVAGNIETIGTLGTYAAPTSGKCRFKEVDAAYHKGLYEFQFANSIIPASTAKSFVITISGGDAEGDYEVLMVGDDPTVSKLDKLLAYVQLMTRTDTAIKTDRAVEFAAINANQGTGAGSYDNTKSLSFSDVARSNIQSYFDNNDTLTLAALDDAGPGSLTPQERIDVANAVMDLADGIYPSITPRQALRLSVAANGGKTNGMEAGSSSTHFRDPDDSKNVITAVLDASNNRTSVALDLT